MGQPGATRRGSTAVYHASPGQHMAAAKRRTDPQDGRIRCQWASEDPMLAAYHDVEWGRPIRTGRGHLERMALEIFQCGLSWKIILIKRLLDG